MATRKYVALAAVRGLKRPEKGVEHVLGVGEEIELDSEHHETTRLVNAGVLVPQPDGAPAGEA